MLIRNPVAMEEVLKRVQPVKQNLTENQLSLDLKFIDFPIEDIIINASCKILKKVSIQIDGHDFGLYNLYQTRHHLHKTTRLVRICI